VLCNVLKQAVICFHGQNENFHPSGMDCQVFYYCYYAIIILSFGLLIGLVGFFSSYFLKEALIVPDINHLTSFGVSVPPVQQFGHHV